jgi:asparagine synthase (glutamine-hydrolysing)
MCGFTGFLQRRGGAAEELEALARSMASRIVHRGPDDSGEFADAPAGLAFGFRRLSIVDLSPLGHQPMTSASGRYTVIYNGEVYNFLALRAELEREGASFRGHSDTEVMLAAFEAWGIETAVQRFNAMFAMAVWDRVERVLWLGRDRIGKKPLYYGRASDGALLFASELKALFAYPAFEPKIDRDVLALYLRFGYVPGPYCIYEGFRKVPPATLLRFDAQQLEPRVVPYWSLADVAASGAAAPFAGDEKDAVDELERNLLEAVRLRMVADVPLGAFLSGGVDSSLIVGLMQSVSSRPVKTFTIGFHEQAYNEAHFAKAVADHVHTDHTELYLSAEETEKILPLMPAIYDEPFADSSQVPTYLVSRLARSEVTVALSGDAGDELFGGYNRYLWASSRTAKLMRLPRPLRLALGRSLRGVPARAWDRMYRIAEPLLPGASRMATPGEKAHKLGRTLSTSSMRAAYADIVTFWREPLVFGANLLPTALDAPPPRLGSLTEEMMYLDAVTYLVDDILVKVDRAAMAVSLEPRAPYLDVNVVELAWRLPLQMKLRGGRGKWILRRLLDRYVPPALIERPKAGFGIPIGDWIRGPLRGWADEYLNEGRLRREAFLDPEPVTRMWREHLAGRGNHQSLLWAVLMFEAWLESQQRDAVAECRVVDSPKGRRLSSAVS